ncbi:unnamed protein product, partial [Symbiodinium necroappetens]
VKRLLPGVGKGLLPADLRSKASTVTIDSLSPKSESVDGYLHFCYTSVAEPLSETHCDVDCPYLKDLYVSAGSFLSGELGGLRRDIFECWLFLIGGSIDDLVVLPDEPGLQEALFLDSDPVALAAADTGPGTARRQPKWIPHQSYECMYAHYQLYMSGKGTEEEPASYRCATCSRFSQRIKNALAEADKIPLQRAQEQHINQVMSHRTLCTRLNHLSEESTSRPGISDPTGILKIDLDGADQSKTLLPKGLDNNKFLSSLWRAQLHVMGALVHGVAEIYYLVSPDVMKDSSTEVSLLCDVLQTSETILRERDIEVPPYLALEACIWDGLSSEHALCSTVQNHESSQPCADGQLLPRSQEPGDAESRGSFAQPKKATGH